MYNPNNRLIHESSPYLLQHAHNPVDWYPWGEEAFEKARQEDKPVLVSIGYAACHWCHVMERESFEDLNVASIMNQHFVNIKVDREERPDIDHIYMDAVQAISGSGGWPLNVFLTPEKKPFYGGTYFPPRKAFNRASWTDVLLSLSQAYKEQKDEIEKQAESLTSHLQLSNSFGLNASGADGLFTKDKIEEAFQSCMKSADREWGGFGRAPKFPQTQTISFLLRYGHLNGKPEAIQQGLLSLDKMLQGGLYDQAGGGFARYSTDNQWLAPHFEKMLYDNALLVSILADAFQLTQNTKYKEVIEETLAFVERELMDTSGGFFSALDADSEGEEGKFYVWEYEEVKSLLGRDAEPFCAFFDISANGNWEGKNILWIKKPVEEFAGEQGYDPEGLRSIIKKGKKLLLEKRKSRVRPQLDDKVLLGWNALMNIAYSKVYAVTGNPHYRQMAERNMKFMLHAFSSENELLQHSWKENRAKYPAFLDDYSHLIAALIELGQATADYSYFDKARRITNIVLEHFDDKESAFFFYTHDNQKDVLLRKKEIYDAATPSGNSMMACNLYRLSLIYDKNNWREKAEEMVGGIGDMIIKYATSFGLWLNLFFEMVEGTNEIAIIGKEWENYLGKVMGIYVPHKLIMGSEKPVETYPILRDKEEDSGIRLYLCRNYACNQPVTTLERLISLLSVK